MNGPTGLDYNVVFSFMDMLKVKRRERAEMIAAIKIMEREALIQMNKD